MSRLNWLFIVCFSLCSVARMHGQAYFSEDVDGFHSGSGCNKSSSTVLDISCESSWSDENATGYEAAGAKNSFGIMSGGVLAEVICGAGGCSDADSANASFSINDSLSIVGLNNEPTAFLKIAIACPGCPQYKGLPGLAVYQLDAWWQDGSASCATQSSPRCTLTAPISYDPNNGQPNPTLIARTLALETQTNVKGGAPNAKIVTWVEIDLADVGATVVDQNGRIIEGVTVVGASGHAYN